MGSLDDVTTGRESGPPRIVMYGTEGIGKSTFGAAIEGSIFIPTEDGLGQIDCAKFPMRSQLHQVEEDLNTLATSKHDYSAVVIDTLAGLERLIWDTVCRDANKSSIAEIPFGKGYAAALILWRRVLRTIDKLRAERGMMALLIGHSRVEKFDDPLSASYDRYSLRLYKTSAELVYEWADAILFATRRTRISADDDGRVRAAPVGGEGGERILRTTGGPACIAKNRYRLPEEIPLSWSALLTGIVPDEEPETKKKTRKKKETVNG